MQSFLVSKGLLHVLAYMSFTTVHFINEKNWSSGRLNDFFEVTYLGSCTQSVWLQGLCHLSLLGLGEKINVVYSIS